MKRSGRTLKQRLYGLRHIGGYLKRARYFRGHGVHSPYVYNIVRKVFMQRELVSERHDLYDALTLLGIAKRRCTQLQNLMEHCGYDSWAIDAMEERDFVVATLNTTFEHLRTYAQYAHERGITLCIMSPYNNANRWAVCREIVEEHPSTTVDNRSYLLVFNNHLPKQRFIL